VPAAARINVPAIATVQSGLRSRPRCTGPEQPPKAPTTHLLPAALWRFRDGRRSLSRRLRRSGPRSQSPVAPRRSDQFSNTPLTPGRRQNRFYGTFGKFALPSVLRCVTRDSRVR
jgi:hypothetical protein